MRTKKYVGNISGRTMRTAIKKALEVRPEAKRLFIETDGNDVAFVIHVKDENGEKHDVTVHKIKVRTPEDVREVEPTDELFDNRYPICASIPAILECGTSYTNCLGERTLESDRFRRMSSHGVACPRR